MGTVRPSLYLLDGYVLANGATVKRADYPRLVALADAQSLWTDDTAANLGLYGKGDGTTTMVLPNWVGRMAQYASAAGASVAAGLPNIAGRISHQLTYNKNIGTGGALSIVNLHDNTVYVVGSTGQVYDLFFNASRSSAIYGNSTTVQPPAINVLPILRY